MVVGISVFELHLPGSRSLKEKRRVIKSLIDRIAGRYRVSIYESGHQELRQRSEVALALIAASDREARRMLESIRGLIDDESECELTIWEPQFLEAWS